MRATQLLSVLCSLLLVSSAACRSTEGTEDRLSGADRGDSETRVLSGNRTGVAIRSPTGDGREADKEIGVIALDSLCEIDGNDNVVAGRCLKDLAQNESAWTWERTNATAADGALLRLAVLTVPLKSQIVSCDSTLTINTSEAASVELSVSTTMDGGAVMDLSPGSVTIDVAVASWPFCSEANQLKLSLAVDDAADASGRTGSVRGLDDVRSELAEVERELSDSVSRGADSIRTVLLKDDASRTRICSEAAAEDLDRPMLDNRTDGSQCRGVTTEMAEMMRELA